MKTEAEQFWEDMGRGGDKENLMEITAPINPQPIISSAEVILSAITTEQKEERNDSHHFC